MSSTCSRAWAAWASAFFAILFGASLIVSPVRANSDAIPRPPELERDVEFWIRVYTEINTNSGFMHDERNLAVVYDTLQFTPNAAPRERERIVEAARERIAHALSRIAAGASPLTAEEQRIRDLWGAEGTPARLREAQDLIRFQLGQSDRFRQGLIRSGAWSRHIADTLAQRGLPPEIAVLPHVESSFDPAAYSKVGAAGLWQFMRSTGRRYMRIDSDVDDRLDPFRSTEAAAQLLSYNYRLLGTWPLALTAYNHGAAGMRRARDAMGTDDIVKIVRGHRSPTFGFASRNFYVSFLAALEIDRNPEKYFGPIQHAPEVRFQEIELPAFVPVGALLRTVKVDRDLLRQLNPALTRAVWDEKRYVPRGYRLRLPVSSEPWTAKLLAQRLAPDEQFERQVVPRRHRIQRGETLAGIARQYGLSIQTLARLNGIRTSTKLRAGRTLDLPETAPARVARASRAAEPKSVIAEAASPPAETGAVSAAVAEEESAQDAAAVAATAKPAEQAEPVSAAQAEALSPALGPAAETPQTAADPFDYSVSQQGTIVVAASETLGHYADWLGITAGRLRQINRMKFGAPVLIGRSISLDFSKVSREAFEQRRREYHRTLQASYFAAHRILGTEVYVAKRGDSLWTITQRYGRLPVWLLQQYNPDTDLSEMHPGLQVVVPKVEQVTAVPG